MSKSITNGTGSKVSNEAQVNSEAETLSELKVNGRIHIIRPYGRENDEPNYRNTGMALVGVLKLSETFNQFKKAWTKRRLIYMNL